MAVQALVDKMSTEAGDFAPGPRQVALPAGAHRIGAFVCYESGFPNFVRRFARDGADLYVNISNDGWYGRSAAREQHLKIVRMRAVENRRWILRATNDGVTSTIDPAGRVWRNLPPYTDGAARTGYSYVKETRSTRATATGSCGWRRSSPSPASRTRFALAGTSIRRIDGPRAPNSPGIQHAFTSTRRRLRAERRFRSDKSETFHSDRY